MQGLDSRISRNATIGAVAALVLTPVGMVLCSRGLSAQGATSTFESTQGQLVQNGESIEYNYTVEGKQYTGSRMTFLPGGERVKLGRGISLSQPVSVYYDMDHPERAVLAPGAKLSDFFGCLLVLSCGVGIAGGLFFYAHRARVAEQIALRFSRPMDAQSEMFRRAA